MAFCVTRIWQCYPFSSFPVDPGLLSLTNIISPVTQTCKIHRCISSTAHDNSHFAQFSSKLGAWHNLLLLENFILLISKLCLQCLKCNAHIDELLIHKRLKNLLQSKRRCGSHCRDAFNLLSVVTPAQLQLISTFLEVTLWEGQDIFIPVKQQIY